MAKNKAPNGAAMLKEEEVQEMVEGLNEEQTTALVPILRQLPLARAEAVMELVGNMQGDQAGLEEMDSRWSPSIIKLYQPVTKEAPKGLAMGGMYTDDGEILPSTFRFVPLYMHPAHVKFSEGDQAPSCRSEDSKISIYGDLCKDCEDLPFRHGEPTDCSKYRYVYVFDEDFKRIYKMQLGKTSYRAGTKLERFMRGSGDVWSKVYALETKEVERKSGGVYFVFVVSATGDKVTDEVNLELGQMFNAEIVKARMRLKDEIEKRRSEAGSKAASAGPVERVDGDIVAPADAGEPDFGSDKSM